MRENAKKGPNNPDLPPQQQPPAGVDDGSLVDEGNKHVANRKKPEPNKPDPEEVQYPGYFKDGGSL